MIRVIRRRIILPRGDTGSFSIPSLIDEGQEGAIAVFSVLNPLTRMVLFEKIVSAESKIITIPFLHEDTVNLPAGKYKWDLKIYINPQYDEDRVLIGGQEIHSYYSAFSLPTFILSEVAEHVPRS